MIRTLLCAFQLILSWSSLPLMSILMVGSLSLPSTVYTRTLDGPFVPSMGLNKPTFALLFLFIYEYAFSSFIHFSPFECLILGISTSFKTIFISILCSGTRSMLIPVTACQLVAPPPYPPSPIPTSPITLSITFSPPLLWLV